jgi:hypothetical protein
MKSTPIRVTASIAVKIPTIIEFLLDETGSMSSYLTQTLNGFRDFVDEQRKQDGECYFTLTKFDTRGFRTPYTDLDISMVPYLNQNTFIPNAMTNLRDTMMHRMNAREGLLKSWDIVPRMMFVCMTDGGDNASSHNIPVVRQRISNTIQNQDWAFIYLGAYPGADVAARELGFPEGNIKCFEGTQMQERMQELSSATRAYRAGETKASNIYATTTSV